MATVYPLIKGKKNPASIYIRFLPGGGVDIPARTSMLINPAHWDSKNKKVRNVADATSKDEINKKLTMLQVGIIERYNLDYTDGKDIDRKWLEGVIKAIFGRPAQELKKGTPDHEIYYTDYALWWTANIASTFKVSSNKYLGSKSVKQYEMMVANFDNFQGREKIKLMHIDGAVMDKFSQYMSNTLKYSKKTTSRKIGRFKFFCERAETDGLPVNKKYKEQVFVQEREIDYKEPYLNEDEIKAIYRLDLSNDVHLSDVRDNLIVGLWTGLRVSDFLTRLAAENITEDFIQIKTLKTSYPVAIPIHPMVKEVLKRHNGQLPPKISEQKFNKHIKTIGMLANIDVVMTGGITKVEKKGDPPRKIIGQYKKYLLMTSHICRRSFCTNHYGKVANNVIMAIQGWKKEEQMFEYIKQTNLESAQELKKLWEKLYS